MFYNFTLLTVYIPYYNKVLHKSTTLHSFIHWDYNLSAFAEADDHSMILFGSNLHPNKANLNQSLIYYSVPICIPIKQPKNQFFHLLLCVEVVQIELVYFNLSTGIAPELFILRLTAYLNFHLKITAETFRSPLFKWSK